MRNSHRRRVPVACGRCRRRKIKCSGDSGDGQGCSNCRSAGNTDCQFLRVNSLKLTPKASNWPYPPPGSGGIYTTSTTSKSSLLCGANALQLRGGADDYEFSASDSPAFSDRPAMAMESSQCEDSQSSTYSQSPAYVQPGYGSSSNLFDYTTSAWTSKGWESVLGLSRPSHSTIYPDPETSNSMAQSAFSYLIPSHILPSSEASLPVTAAMAEGSSAELTAQDRTLPTPNGLNQQPPSGLPGLAFPPELTPSSSLSAEERNAYWSPRSVLCQDSRSPIITAASNVLFSNSASSASSGPDTSPNSTSVFSSLSMPITTEELISSTLALPTTACSSMPSASYPVQAIENSGDGRAILPSSTWPGPAMSTHAEHSPSHEAYLEKPSTAQRIAGLSDDGAPGLYHYTTSEKCTRAGDIRNAGSVTLMNGGFEYAPPRHSHLSHSPYTLGILSGEMSEYHHAVVEGIHRAPVSPLGGQSGY
ncbi:hypothetical protein PDE_05870 [Penicillium oxalicum 114-2]|uniref:Zn(2)-C6 fungal-type domain-containing protein n=1 Tax=Penicillium oxalicum (strain 114-2 / CGMCC 5302) TaxID=933388 RepID=S8B879_PENO1|nr:hypothetical protein PDE_05870 [Penicillium oxalicum 114-2]